MSTGRERIDWVDAGRGLAIVLVVLFHATNWLGEAGVDVAAWLEINGAVSSIRLPLFFTMAGLFAQKWMTASWRSLWRTKLSLFAWVYGVWSVIATFTFMLGLNLQGAEGNYLAQLRNLLVAPFLPRFELWFIWALALFFVVAKLIQKLPIWVQLSLTGVLSVVALSGVFSGNTGWVGMGKYLFFFLLGLLGRDAILRWSIRLPALPATIVVIVWLATAIAGAVFDLKSVPGYYFVECIAGVAAGVAVSRVLARVPGTKYLGARTLPIYLTHTSVILVAVWLLWHISDQIQGPLWGAILPPLLTAVACALSLGVARLAGTLPVARYLYEQPRWLAGHARSAPE